jgi:signal recognition particle subunit SRP72
MSTNIQSLRSLLQQASITDDAEVLKASNEALKKSKTDAQAQHSKVVALLKLDRYEDSLRVFEDAGDNLKSRAALEYAYALYKSGQLGKAVEVARTVSGEDGRGAKHVEAQAVGIPLQGQGKETG